MKTIEDTEQRERLLSIIRERAVKFGQPNEFTLASGRKSDFYVDCKMVELSPDGAALIGRVLFDVIQELDEIDAIGGLATGAIPLVTSTLVACHENEMKLDGFWVREQAKEHGTKKTIEGKELQEGTRVVIVDDVFTTGGSAMKAVEAAEAAGATVVAVVALVDREEGAAARFQGYQYIPVFTKTELKKVYLAVAKPVQLRMIEFAFPQLSHSASSGMTLRDYIAAKAMQGWLATENGGPQATRELAHAAYDVADAMLAAREKRDG